MEIQYKIGREVEGPHVIVVPSACNKVGRRHATLIWRDGNVVIEDNESVNGTYVNGRRVARTKIQEGDSVRLGGTGKEGTYPVDLRKIFDSCRKEEEALRTDYSGEFEKVKQAYISYKRKEADLKKRVTVKSQLPVRLVSLLPTVIGAVIAILPNADPNARVIAISVGGAVTGLINIMMIGKSSLTNDQLSEKIMELQIEYQSQYCCPKCGMRYPFTMHWKKLEAEGKCPNPGCNAEFVRKNEKRK